MKSKKMQLTPKTDPMVGTAQFPSCEEIRVSELRYRRLFEAARDGIFLLDIDTLTITDTNPYMSELLEYTRDELIGKELWELGVFSDKDESKDAFRTVQQEGYIRYDDLPLKTKDGELRDVEFVSNVYDEGNVKVIQCNIRNITERKILEKEQAITQERFQVLFEHAPDGILIACPKNYYLEANQSMCRMLGYTREELIGLHAKDIVIPSEVEHISEARDEIHANVDHHRVWRFLRKDGTEFPGEVLVTEMPGGNLLAVIRDITERSANEEKLNRSQANLAKAQQIAHLGSWEMDLPLKDDNTNSLRWSDEVFRIFGYEPGQIEVSNENFFLAAHPDERESIKAAMTSALGNEGTYRLDHRIVLPDGAERVVHEHGEIVFDKSTGDPLKMIGTVQDISERKRIEKELTETAAANAQSLALIDTILANAPIGFAFHDRDLAYVRINETLAEINGLPVEQHLGRTLIEILPNMAGVLDPIMRKVIDTGIAVVDYELSGETKAEPGKSKFWVVSFYPVRMNGGEVMGVGVLVSEVTDRKRAEEELRESEEKFASAFELAPIGVALVLPDGRWLKVNRALCKLTGYTEAELLDRTFQDITHPDDLKRDLLNARRLIKGKITHYQMEKRYIHKLGHIVFVSINVSLVRDSQDEPRYFISQIQDITATKLALDELRESESLLATSQRITHLGSWIMDISESGTAVENSERWSDEHYRIFGFEPGEIEITDEVFYNSVHPEDREPLARLLRETIDHQQPYDLEHRIILPDGTERIVHAMAEVVVDVDTDTPLKLLGSVQDITERKRAEAEIDLTLERLKRAQRMGRIGDWEWDLKTELISWSSQVYEILGRDPKLGPPGYEENLEYYDILSRQVLQAKVTAAIESGEKQDYDLFLVRPDGEHIYVQAMCEPRKDAEGNIVALSGTIQDISDSRLAERALRKSEFRYHSLFENMLEGYAYCETVFDGEQLIDFIYTEVNGAFETMTGLQNVVGKKVSDVIPGLKQSTPEVFEVYGRVALTGIPEKFESYIEPLSIWLSITAYSSSRENFVAVFDNITARKQADLALQESDEKFHQLADNITDSFWIRSPDLNKIYYISPAFEQIWGRSLENVYARPDAWLSFILPQDRELVREAYEQLMGPAPTIDIEYRITRPDEQVRWVRTRGFQVRNADGELIRLAGIASDITERKQANAALGESEKRYRSVVETAPDAIVTIDDSSTIYFINPAAERIFGYSIDEMKGESLTMLMPEYLRHVHEAGFKQYRQTGVKHVPWEYVELTGLHKSGREIPITISFSEYVQHDRRYFTGIIRDISERKQAMEALRESEERYRELVENAHDIIYSHDLEGNYTSISKAAEQITGYTTAEALQMNLMDTVAPGQLEKAKEMIARKLNGENITAYELAILAKDGHQITVEVNTKLVRKDGIPIGIQGIARDVTERKSLQEQLLQSQKLESLGRLAGGIAHDFNNMLTAINGGSDLILRGLDDGDPLRSDILEIKQAGERAAMLTGQLLAFSRQQILQPELININETISETSSMLKRMIGEDIELETVLFKDLGSVRADRGQLSQILINLAVNARDAMPDGGKLTIETSNKRMDQKYVRDHVDASPGDYVLLSVSDTGSGIDHNIQEQIFEPFFTTKRIGKGTGLGLAMVYGIVKQSGGAIFVYSEKGQGATFKIFLPLVGDRAVAQIERSPSLEFADGNETILLVEDEELVRTLTKKMLQKCGYKVIDVADGVEALNILELTNEKPDLLITDVVMPRMGGRELAQKLHELIPDLPVLFASGYTDDAVVRHGILETNCNFIQKPFVLEDLARKVRELLDP